MVCEQRGVTLIELMLVIGLMSVTTLLSFYDKQLGLEQAKAREVGGYIFQYNNAVRSALAQGVVTNTTLVHGTDWLKNSTCGGVLAVDSEFLSCDFPSATTADPIRFGNLSWSTAINISGSNSNRKTVATTVTSPFSVSDHLGASKIRADLAGIASLSAAAALTSGYKSGGPDGFSPFTATTDSSFKSDAFSAKISVVASNTASNDIWLRADGGNKMHSSLSFDGISPLDRTIVGASSIENLAGQMLRIGSGSGLTPASSAGVVIDSTAEVLGDFRVRNTLYVDNTISVTGDINALGKVSADGDITSKSSIAAKGDVTTEGALVGQVFYDANDVNYYVDPASSTTLNELKAKTIATMGRMTAGEYVEISGIAVAGEACLPNGLIGRDLDGAILSCQSGAWKGGSSAGGGTLTKVGSFWGAVTRTNDTDTPMFVGAHGGYGSGGTCPNRYQMSASVMVNGAWVVVSDSSHTYDLGNKSTAASFMVPARTAYKVTSSPYACGNGLINLTEFTM